MSAPLVSVLMTAYNREQYIAEAIESVLAQTLTDFELIIVDDCSKDRTVEIARQYTSDRRVSVYVNAQTLRQFPNRNRAAELATGQYLKYVDSDDLIYPHCLQVMVYYMEQIPDAGLGMDVNSRGIAPQPIRLDPVSAWRQALLGPGLLWSAPLSTIIRSDAFRRCGGFRFVEATTGDIPFLYDVCSLFPSVLFSANLGYYRLHAGQEFASLTTDRALAESARHLPGIIFSERCPLSPEERLVAHHNLVGPFARYCMRLAIRGQIRRAWRLWSYAQRPIREMAFARIRPKRPYAPCF